MKTEEIKDLFVQFENIVCEYKDVECWSARELQKTIRLCKMGEISKCNSQSGRGM